MSTTLDPTTVSLPASVLPLHWTLADVRRHLGGIPLQRIRLYPPPGMATEDDALRLHGRESVLCEVVDGILVEKAVGTFESLLAVFLISELQNFLNRHPLGLILGADGPLHLKSGNMRIPDVSYLKWERFPARLVPRHRVWLMPPDLAVEILSLGNTAREIRQKTSEYFASGTEAVWIIDPKKREAFIHTSPTDRVRISPDDDLECPSLLPGFRLRLGDLLDRVGQE